jgi:hypothetical protein
MNRAKLRHLRDLLHDTKVGTSNFALIHAKELSTIIDALSDLDSIQELLRVDTQLNVDTPIRDVLTPAELKRYTGQED